MVIVVMGYGGNMSFNTSFYRKPKPETMKKNREIARTQYKEEMTWLKENLSKLGQYKNKFLVEMYTIMVVQKSIDLPSIEMDI